MDDFTLYFFPFLTAKNRIKCINRTGTVRGISTVNVLDITKSNFPLNFCTLLLLYLCTIFTVPVILNPSNTLILNSEYKRLRNELTSSLRNCELQYYSNKLELNKSGIKNLGCLKNYPR